MRKVGAQTSTVASQSFVVKSKSASRDFEGAIEAELLEQFRRDRAWWSLGSEDVVADEVGVVAADGEE
ncbi:hypothetical protein PanWU01x14_146060 [Parasponia andersonii]|uniref:Uncharacterized protein n=1 Tax=Parasponia andersonii TaxID=3476 RepID=A0A2P5CKE2_PARAD|nr:hypothetical protein PanWU01x14_146060 [Parasponia andersonii]